MLEMPQNFLSGTLKLEGVIQLPQIDGWKVPAVALCHPHPLYGGNLQNNVIVAVSEALVNKGIAALRFNFRGVDLSEGEFNEGVGEKDDVIAAVEELAGRPDIDRERLGVMGYSFGGMVALGAVKDCALVRAVAAVSPLVTPGLLQGLNMPSYIIYGTLDHVVDANLLSQEVKKMIVPAQVELVERVDHFWFGHEKKMCDKVASFFEQVL